MIELMMSASLGAAMIASQPARNEPVQITVEFRLIEADLGTGRTWGMNTFGDKPKPSIRFEDDGTMELGVTGLRFTSMRSTNWHFILTDDAIVEVSGWRYAVGGPNEGIEDSPFSVLSAPRVLVLDGQEASVSIGQAIEYLEPAGEEGLFRLVTDPDSFEGVSFTVTPKLREDNTVLLDPIDFEFKEVIGHEPVAGLSMPGVGKPILQTVSQRAAMIVGSDETVLIPVLHRDFSERPLLLFVRPRVMSGDSQAQEAAGQNENAPAGTGAPEEDQGSPE